MSNITGNTEIHLKSLDLVALQASFTSDVYEIWEARDLSDANLRYTLEIYSNATDLSSQKMEEFQEQFQSDPELEIPICMERLDELLYVVYRGSPGQSWLSMDFSTVENHKLVSCIWQLLDFVIHIKRIGFHPFLLHPSSFRLSESSRLRILGFGFAFPFWSSREKSEFLNAQLLQGSQLGVVLSTGSSIDSQVWKWLQLPALSRRVREIPTFAGVWFKNLHEKVEVEQMLDELTDYQNYSDSQIDFQAELARIEELRELEEQAEPSREKSNGPTVLAGIGLTLTIVILIFRLSWPAVQTQSSMDSISLDLSSGEMAWSHMSGELGFDKEVKSLQSLKNVQIQARSSVNLKAGENQQLWLEKEARLTISSFDQLFFEEGELELINTDPFTGLSIEVSSCKISMKRARLRLRGTKTGFELEVGKSPILVECGGDQRLVQPESRWQYRSDLEADFQWKELD